MPAVTPLDHGDPSVEKARVAELTAYRNAGYEPEEHFVAVPALDLQIRMVKVGSGPPLVLIPGGHGPGLIWIPFLTEVEGFTVYVMDRPGGGLSDEIDYRSVPLREQAAASTLALFDRFEISEAPIVGNSMGGLWALRFALAHPDRVAKLVLMGCPAIYPGTSAPLPMRLGSIPGLSGWIVRNMMRAGGPEDARETIEFMGHPAETAEGLSEPFAEAWYRMEQVPNFEGTWVSLLQSVLRPWGAHPDSRFTKGDLARIDAPVCLIWGSDDPFGSIETGRAGAEHFRRAEFHQIGVGHLPWLDEPEQCGEIVRSFLTSHS